MAHPASHCHQVPALCHGHPLPPVGDDNEARFRIGAAKFMQTPSHLRICQSAMTTIDANAGRGRSILLRRRQTSRTSQTQRVAIALPVCGPQPGLDQIREWVISYRRSSICMVNHAMAPAIRSSSNHGEHKGKRYPLTQAVEPLRLQLEFSSPLENINARKRCKSLRSDGAPVPLDIFVFRRHSEWRLFRTDATVHSVNDPFRIRMLSPIPAT